ncbi:Hypothetical predicted protein [Marmota monax]|uniref:Uncharacterized protein n=1 Tax=Marmota monax TaxID=9995 RepID=A0A5E4BZK4_MARMO|nr:hypothetical protein GHT09_006331 [Marmota monax]VTJ75077.1 Hypothetical predicted protein [Marmota monax]
MDLSEKWALEEGNWLSPGGIHHFPSTRADSEFVDASPESYSPEELGIGLAAIT